MPDESPRSPESDATTELTFRELQVQSIRRLQAWHGPGAEPWTLADWSNAMCGEAGEAANVVKKIRRHQTRTTNDRDPDLSALYAALATELGDVVAYAVILADEAGIDLGVAVAEKFNAVSVREGHRERLPVPVRPVLGSWCEHYADEGECPTCDPAITPVETCCDEGMTCLECDPDATFAEYADPPTSPELLEVVEGAGDG